MDYSPPGSSVHGILQARRLEWVAISYSRGSPRPRNRAPVSCPLHWQSDYSPLSHLSHGNHDCSHEIKRHLVFGRKAMTNLDSEHSKKQRHLLCQQRSTSQSYGFSSSHVQMWELEHKEGWVPNNWYFRTVLEKTVESPLDFKEIQPVNPKGN